MDDGTGDERRDVVVVGAGPAGIGVAVALLDAGIDDVQVLERGEIGASLRRWPREMRCITPSFPSNSFGAVDLNAVSPATSPAFALHTEHPSGEQWATYLEGVAAHYELAVREGVDVLRVEALGNGLGFDLETTAGLVRARIVVWAAGELGAPRTDAFPGGGLCLPVGAVRAWADVPGRAVAVVGGFESGIDAAVSLVAARPDRRVVVLDASAPWERRAVEASEMLSPYTRGRLDAALATGRLELRGDARVVHAEAGPLGGVTLRCEGGEDLRCEAPPVLATGFRPVLGPVERLVARSDDGLPLVTDDDESTVAPGLFLAGPAIRHEGLVFCFAYKYRARFPVIADAVAIALDRETAPELEAWRAAGMWLDDLTCCADDCVC